MQEKEMKTKQKQRIKEFANLKPNWDSYEGLPTNENIIEQSLQFLDDITREEILEPAVFPTPKGGTQFEWHNKGFYLEVEFLPNGKVEMFFMDSLSGEEIEKDISNNCLEVLEYIKKKKI